MARFTAEQADNYTSSGNTNYFSLKNNNDTARVRFMYNSAEDIEGMSVHKVNIGGKEREVNCPREYNEPIDKCPLCKSGNRTVNRVYIPLYNVDTKQVQIWERSAKYIQRLSSLCARYQNLVSHEFDIVRNGVAGDTKTTYEIYEVSKDNTTLEDLPEIPNVLGTIILDKSYDELLQLAEPNSSNSNVQEDYQPQRRVPARRGDAF